MDEKLVTCEIEEGIATITLNRPEVMNSFSFAMLRALEAQLAALRFDASVRVIIITGRRGSGLQCRR